MRQAIEPTRVGDLRPSQLVYSFGVGASIDLPHLSAIVRGLDEWDATIGDEIDEPRLLAAVRAHLGRQVASLRLPPVVERTESARDEWARKGVPVTVFPRWLRCPRCNRLAPIEAGLFDLKTKNHPFRPDETRFVHDCSTKAKPATALPVRFLLACEAGHLDDFPWVEYAHRGQRCAHPILELSERGATGHAADVVVRCTACDAKGRSLAEAFGERAATSLPRCRGRHPHLGLYEDCGRQTRAILLGASNSWFPVTVSVLAVPVYREPLAQKVADNWRLLRDVTSIQVLEYARKTHQELSTFAGVSDEELLEAIEQHRGALTQDTSAQSDILETEWAVLSDPAHAPTSDDFLLTPTDPPPAVEDLVEQVVLVERVREVAALIGFTRVDPPEELDGAAGRRPAPLSRAAPEWVPCAEVRGEGIFLRLREDRVAAWEDTVRDHPRVQRLWEAHRRWRLRWGLDPDEGWRGPRYVLVHTLAHMLIRELSLECGYGAASLRERLYVGSGDTPMAGLLLYTATPDSEGTLGGLVSLGRPENLGRLLVQALERAKLCASDPLCAEHDPTGEASLHGAACHSCLFASETSCERGNRYLDRGLVVPTFAGDDAAYFAG